MELINLLADVDISLFGQTFDISLNWIGKLVKLIISSGVGVGLGVILFSLILKVIVLPFDIFQRISMRKQNIQMKENQEKMEKLQKQYANDKKMYNQKVMEMQKASGFSMLASCLPMILSMVIFFVAIGAFNAYAKFSTVENYNTLANAYSDAVNEYVVDLNEEDAVYEIKQNADGQHFIYARPKDNEENADKLIYLYMSITNEKAAEIGTDTGKMQETIRSASYFNRTGCIDVERAKAYEETKHLVVDSEGNELPQADVETGLKAFFENKGAAAAEEAYKTEVSSKTKFLWIKNIWATDASYEHPVLSHSDFMKDVAAASCGSSCSSNGSFIVNGKEVEVGSDGALGNDKVSFTNVYEEPIYNKVTKNLGTQKEQANGYFILIVLSIATILVQQIVMQRSQKEQQKYSSVDGQAASTQKMTMIMMTVMFGIFSFMYSSAFSIYMITSNVFSLVSTLIINKAVDAAAEKKEQKQLQEKYNQRKPRTGKYAAETTESKPKKGKKAKGTPVENVTEDTKAVAEEQTSETPTQKKVKKGKKKANENAESVESAEENKETK